MVYFSCPYDSIKVYDLITSVDDELTTNYERDLINTYCGNKSDLTVFSTSNLLDIKFETTDSLGNEEYSEDENKINQRKGFRAYFKFETSLADLKFITGTHIKGTSKQQKRIC